MARVRPNGRSYPFRGLRKNDRRNRSPILYGVHVLVNLLGHSSALFARNSTGGAFVTNVMVAPFTFVPLSFSRRVHNHHPVTMGAGVCVRLEMLRKSLWGVISRPVVQFEVSKAPRKIVSDDKSHVQHCPIKVAEAGAPLVLNTAAAMPRFDVESAVLLIVVVPAEIPAR